jgi:hypothetical protein
MSKAVEAIEAIMNSLFYKVGENDRLFVVSPTGAESPALVAGKQMVLPTKEQLKKGFGELDQPLNPFCESMSRLGTSPVQQHLQRSAKQWVSFMVVMLADAVLKMSNNTKLHKDLPPDLSDILMAMSNAGINDKTQAIFDKLIPAAREANKLAVIYLKGPCTFQGKSVNRLTTIRFPIIEELENMSDKDTVLGVKVPPKQRKALAALFRLVVPSGDSPEEYSAGTLVRTSPYFASFVEAYHKVATRLNLLVNRLKEPLQLPIDPIPLYDVDIIKDFSKYSRELPSFPGNDGGVDETPEEAPQSAQAKMNKLPSVAAAFADPHQQAKTPQPSRNKPQAQATPAGRSFVKTDEPAPYEVSAYQAQAYQAPQANGWSTAQVYHQPNVYQQPPQPQYGQPPQYGGPQPGAWGQQPAGHNQPARLPWGQRQAYNTQPPVEVNPFMGVFGASVNQPGYGQPMPQQQRAWGQQPQQQYGQQPNYGQGGSGL